MTSERTNPSRGPTPEQLAAYHDGELAEAERARVEAWLADDAPAAAELDAWRRLDDLWRAAAPPEPSAAAWSAARDRVAAGRPAPPAPPRPPARRLGLLGWALGLGAAAAAAALLTLALRPRGASDDELEPLAVASPDDVVIISMDGNDTALVAAPAPVEGPLVVTGPDDFKIMQDSALAEKVVQGGVGMIADKGEWNPVP
jgi:anti-sigma factor RsiW